MANQAVSGAKPRIVICGSIAIDRIMSFSGRYRDIIRPDKINVLSVSMLLEKLEDSRGGIGANIASNLAQLGENPALAGSVGHDAEHYIKDLGALGIDVSQIHFSDLPTASFNVITDSEDNQVGGFYQGAMSDSQMVSIRPWANQNILAVISGNNPEAMNRQFDDCRDLGIAMIYDPGQQVTDNVVNHVAGVAGAKIVFINDYELDILCQKLGKTADELKQQVPILVTTLGKSGSLIEGSSLSAPLQIGIAKTDPVDPTGAGDAYRAGFLYGYIRQWDLKTCGQLGATVASFIIERHGTQQTFTINDVEERYKQNFNEEIKL
jgi:adenosine kinase